MATKAKAGSVISTRTQDGCIIVSVKGMPDIIFNPDKVSAVNRAKAMRYGFEVRLTRAAALSRDSDTGKSATAAEKHAAILQVSDHLQTGSDEWALKPTRARGPDMGTIILAMVRLGVGGITDVDSANALLDKLAAKREIEREAAAMLFAEAKDIASEILKIQSERAAEAARVSSDDLLEGLDDEEGDDDDEPTDE